MMFPYVEQLAHVAATNSPGESGARPSEPEAPADVMPALTLKQQPAFSNDQSENNAAFQLKLLTVFRNNVRLQSQLEGQRRGFTVKRERSGMEKTRLSKDALGNTGVSRRELLKRGGAAGLGIGAAACGVPFIHTTQTSAQAQISGKVSLAYLGTADQVPAWNSLFALFKTKYPNIEIEPQANPVNNWAGFFDAISTQIAGGKSPDIVQVATEGQRLFASRGLVQPINDLLTRDKDELADFYADVHPNLVKWNEQYNNSADGKTYYIPGAFNTMGVWCNTTLLKKAGVDIPSDNWTWDELAAAGAKIAATGAFGIHVTPEYFVGIMPYLLTNGASTLSADWSKATVNTPQAIEAATFMRSLVDQKISPEPGGTFDPFTALAQDKLAMFGGGRWPVISIRTLKAVDKIKILPWPQKTMKGSPVGWNTYPIMKGAQNVEAAWAFVKFITSKEAETYFAQQGGTIVPARKSVANSDAFLSNTPEGMIRLYEALDYATPIPSPDKGNVVQKDIEDAFKQILVGNVAPTDGLNALNDKIQGNL